MTDEEILRSFKLAKKPREQVQILAHLNDTKVENIVDILKAQGVDHRQLPRNRHSDKPVEQPVAKVEQLVAPPETSCCFVDAIKTEEVRLRARLKELEDMLAPLRKELEETSLKLVAVGSVLSVYAGKEEAEC